MSNISIIKPHKGVDNMAFRSLEETFVYRHLNSGNALSSNIHKILQHGTILKQQNL